jgi:RNA polymerase sigma-70 factor (ECF subfamily)
LKSSSQAQLVEAAQNGCLDSFAILYERYYSPMVAVAYSILADIHLAEDAAQQSFAIAAQNLPKLKSKDKFAGWLAGICRNTARQMQRTQGRIKTLNEPPPNRDKKDACADTIRRAVWQLRPFYREPIVLRYYDNMPYQQIAAVLGISVPSVHGRLTRAKRKIKKYLKNNGFTGGDYENA